MTDAQSFLLPWPPSVNTRERYPTPSYREWFDEAAVALFDQEAYEMYGTVEIEIRLGAPSKRKWDLDNRIKAILDLLVHWNIIEDDNSRVVKKETLIVDDDICGAMVTVIPIVEKGGA